MLPADIATAILEAHITHARAIQPIEGFRIELQLDYSGSMARGAYQGWRKGRQAGRKKVGCFDFKIFRAVGPSTVPLVHTRVIPEAGLKLDRKSVEGVFSGADPHSFALAPEQLTIAQEVQLAMLEQEINWGDEQFQSFTYFPPSEGRRPRDFIVAYLRRIFSEPDFLAGIERIRSASGTRGTLPRPRPGSVWNPYLEPVTSEVKPWLTGPLLQRYREAAESFTDNPHYRLVYGENGV